MAKGLKIPVRANKRGGVETVEGDDQAQQIVSTGLGDGDSDNAFEQDLDDLGMGSGMIFDASDPSFRARVLRRLFAIFKRWEAEERFKLVRDSIEWSEDEGKGDTFLDFRYINLESDKPKDFRKTFAAPER